MTDHKAVRDKRRCPSHPGEAIGDILRDFPAVAKTTVADALGISRQYLHAIIAGRKPVSPQVAVRVAKAIGGTAESWLRMQAAYDTWHAEREVDLNKVKVLELI